MVTIKGVGGVSEPVPRRTGDVRGQDKKAGKVEGASDGVQISREAQEAADVSRLIQIAKTEPEIREDRVAAAKARLESGEYRKREVVEQVAHRLSKFLP